MSLSLPPDPTAASHDRHAALHGGFRWQVPARFNMAQACCARWARSTPEAVAIRWEHEDGRQAAYRYVDLERAARALAALQGDATVTDAHIRQVARPALRHRLRRDPLDDTDASVRVDRVLAEVFGG